MGDGGEKREDGPENSKLELSEWTRKSTTCTIKNHATVERLTMLPWRSFI